MYSDQKIPAPFGQPRHNRRTAKQTSDIPAPPALSAEEKSSIPISAEEKAVPKAAAGSSSLPTPFLAFLLFDLLSHKKEF